MSTSAPGRNCHHCTRRGTPPIRTAGACPRYTAGTPGNPSVLTRSGIGAFPWAQNSRKRGKPSGQNCTGNQGSNDFEGGDISLSVGADLPGGCLHYTTISCISQLATPRFCGLTPILQGVHSCAWRANQSRFQWSNATAKSVDTTGEQQKSRYGARSAKLRTGIERRTGHDFA